MEERANTSVGNQATSYTAGGSVDLYMLPGGHLGNNALKSHFKKYILFVSTISLLGLPLGKNEINK